MSDPVGHLYNCPAPADFADPACRPFTGAFIVDSLGFSFGSLWIPFLALVAFVLVFIAGSAVLLYFHIPDIGVATARAAVTDHLSKESLLNMMTKRLRGDFGTQYVLGGELLLAGSVVSPAVVNSVFSFVEQDDDFLIPTLTVRETLRSAAGLRLPSWMSRDQKTRKAESTLAKLGLTGCADTLVGDLGKMGISTGEKRRVAIGLQLLTEPRVLILDEPTSGLDSFTASSVTDILRNLAAEGKTIILTIHQPRANHVWANGYILLLARTGYSIFARPAQSILPHFARLG
ncbi:MAG: hypothetical protein Q9192_005203 [Flavoplaca navasiana]